ncbi:MAG: CDGSH iron-sulfur domain-containing protein [Planctomycetes bacterium]|nr:CDGSH iron-sulfur domain-containing protein [Planctomycetota bacterium]
MGDIKVTNHGPYRIEGEFRILDVSGQAWDLSGRKAVSLCRCGHSANKPFCDGSHARVGFTSECAATKLPPPAPKP